MDDPRLVALTLGYQESLQKNVSNNLKHMWRNTLIRASLHTRKEGGQKMLKLGHIYVTPFCLYLKFLRAQNPICQAEIVHELPINMGSQTVLSPFLFTIYIQP